MESGVYDLVTKRYIAAAVQYESKFSQKQHNITCLKELTLKAASRAKLIVLPEMATTGICFYDREEVAPLVETIPGPTTDVFAGISSKHSCYIVLSLPEVDPTSGNYYNSCVLIGPQGVVGKYRKTHLFATDTKWASVGDLGFPVFDTDLGRIGCMICNDFYFFEPSRIMSLNKVEVLCNPTNWGEEKCPAPTWFSRAWENGAYLISANRWGCERGMEFAGGSSIISPEGKLISYIGGEIGIAYGEVDLDRARQKTLSSGMHRITDRKPKRYHALNLSTYLYNPYYNHRLYPKSSLPKGKISSIAVYQYNPQPLAVEHNLKKIEQAISTAKKKEAELVVLPELAITGAINSKAEAQKVAKPIPESNLFGAVKSIANKYNIYIVLSLAERENDELFNTVVLVGAKGLKMKYQKVHLNQSDKVWASEGENEFSFYDLNIGRIGLLTGDDCIPPEPTMCLASLGVDLICVPAAVCDPMPLGLEDDPIHWHLWRTRAVETNTIIAFANQACGDGAGFSGIFGPTDWPRSENWPRSESVLVNDDSLAYYTGDTGSGDSEFPSVIVRIKENVRMRLPYLYKDLVK